MRTLTALLAFSILVAVGATARADDFWRFWGDSRAELSSYDLVQPRYGALHQGSVVLVFVTEDFADDLRVKADPGKHPASDVYPVLKLNEVRDFQTGIYDYNLMTSVFVRTELPGWPLVKASFSAQEWCGHVYMQWIARGGELSGTLHSYFDGEADAAPKLPLPAGGVVEEQVPILVRGLRGDWVPPGGSKTFPFLRAARRSRFAHEPQAWGEATVTRAAQPVTAKTALGAIKAWVYTVAEKAGPGALTTTWTVEDAPPHRLLAWEGTDGEKAKILGSARLPYWQLNKPGDEVNLKKIGLPIPKRR